MRIGIMKSKPIALLKWLVKRVIGYLLAGILITMPLALTAYLLVWIFNWMDGAIQPVISQIAGRQITGIGFTVTMVLILLTGFIASFVFGRRLLRFGDSLFGRVPLAGNLYTAIRQITQSFSEPRKTGFMQVVLIEFPRRGARTIGFITNESSDASGKKLLNVFVPTAPNPTSGFLQIVEESEIIRTDISVDDALKMVVSGGRMSPEEVREKLLIATKKHDTDLES